MIQYISRIPSSSTLLRMVGIFIWISTMSENLWAFKQGTAKCRTGPTTWNKAESNFVIVLLLANNSDAMPRVGAFLWCKIQVWGQRWGLLRRTDSRTLANITLQLCSRNSKIEQCPCDTNKPAFSSLVLVTCEPFLSRWYWCFYGISIISLSNIYGISPTFFPNFAQNLMLVTRSNHLSHVFQLRQKHTPSINNRYCFWLVLS